MSRPIDSDHVIARLDEIQPFAGNKAANAAINLAKDVVRNAPTLSPDDVRGVVHCKDCDLWNRWDSTGHEDLGNFACSCARWTVEDGVTFFTKPTDFCSYGERTVSEDA